jgi:branched-chain amino acid transport system substrate-binding protein
VRVVDDKVNDRVRLNLFPWEIPAGQLWNHDGACLHTAIHVEVAMSGRVMSIVAASAIACMFLTACSGGSTPARTGEKAGTNSKLIRIASQSPLSGGQSAIGVDLKNGAELALMLNKGPLEAQGFKIELAAFDDQANPDTGVANAKQIVADPAILAVVGHFNSGVQIPSSEEYHAAGLANVSAANTNPKVTDRGYREISRVVGRDDVQGQVGAQFAAKRGIASVYIIHDKTAYGQGVATFFQREAEKLGLKVLGFDGTDEKANFDAILSLIMNARPSMLYFGGIYDQSAVLYKQAREKGFTGLLMGPDGTDSSDLVKIGGAKLVEGGGTFYSTVAGPSKVYPGTAKFQADFKAKYGADPQPFAAQAYDAMSLCLKGIAAAAGSASGGIPTRAAVVDAIRGIKDFPGITGTINFNKKGDLTEANYFVIQVVSADPAKWNENNVVETLKIAPPE